MAGITKVGDGLTEKCMGFFGTSFGLRIPITQKFKTHVESKTENQ